MRRHQPIDDPVAAGSDQQRSRRRRAMMAGVSLVVLAVAGFVALQMQGTRDVELGPAIVPGPALPSDDTVAIPTTDVPNDEAARVGGFLEGDPNVDGGCLWLGQGPGYERISAVWPPGYRARFDPIELIDAQGNVVARENDFIEANGGYHPDRPMERCRVSDNVVWVGPHIRVVDYPGS